MKVRVIKSYEIVRTLYETHPDPLPFDEDAAIAYIRSIFPVASVHTQRVRSDYAKNIMREVLETLLSDLNNK